MTAAEANAYHGSGEKWWLAQGSGQTTRLTTDKIQGTAGGRLFDILSSVHTNSLKIE